MTDGPTAGARRFGRLLGHSASTNGAGAVARSNGYEPRLLAAALDGMAEAVAIVSAGDGLISYTNRSWNETFGYADGEAVGRHMSIAYAPSDGSSSADPHEIVTALEHNGLWRGETLNVRKDGSGFPQAISISEFDDDRHARMWVMVGRRLPEDSR